MQSSSQLAKQRRFSQLCYRIRAMTQSADFVIRQRLLGDIHPSNCATEMAATLALIAVVASPQAVASTASLAVKNSISTLARAIRPAGRFV